MIIEGEYQKRIASLRKRMEMEGLDALLVYSWKRGNLRYLTGYHPDYIANVGMAVIPVKGEPSMFIRFPFDLPRALRESAIHSVYASGDIMTMTIDVVKRMRELKIYKGTVGIAGGDSFIEEIPASLASAIEKEFPLARFKDASGLLMDERIVKSEGEMNCLKESACITDNAITAASKYLKAGATDFSVIAEAEKTARIMGAEQFFFVVSTDGTRDPIGPPNGRLIRENSVVIIEGATSLHGYWTQAAATFSVGKASEKQRNLYIRTYEAYVHVVRCTVPGAPLGSLTNKADSVLWCLGMDAHIEADYGHGVGLDLPESPQIRRNSETLVREGMVLVVHPCVRIPGEAGAFVGGTVIIRSQEAIPLHSIRGDFA